LTVRVVRIYSNRTVYREMLMWANTYELTTTISIVDMLIFDFPWFGKPPAKYSNKINNYSPSVESNG